MSAEDIDITNDDQCEGCLTITSEFREHLLKSQMEWTVKGPNTQGQVGARVQDSSYIQATCKGDSSKSSRESSISSGNNVSVPKFLWFKSMSEIVGLTAAWHQNKVEGSLVEVNTKQC